MENVRISTVKSFLDLPLNEEKELENLVFLASEICETPIASIMFIDDKRQYAVVSIGGVVESSCDVAFCSHTVRGKVVLEIPDAFNDSIFAANPLVTGDPYIRFYAGAPLVTSSGIAVGSLCVIDQQPKKLTTSQVKSLEILSGQVMRRLELQLNVQRMKESIVAEQHNKELLEQAEIIKTAFYDTCEDYFVLLNNNFEIVSFNSSSLNFFHRQRNGPTLQKGRKIFEYLLPSNIVKVRRFLEQARAGKTTSFEILANPGSENAFWNRFTISPAYNSHEALIGIACIGCDIDKEKRQQEKIEMQYSTLSKIAHIHSHEIRHPLTNILSIIDLLKKEDFTMTKQYVEFLEISSKELDEVIRKVVSDSYTSS